MSALDKLKSLRRSRRITKRRLIQLYSALLYNAHLRGFVDGEIFTGLTKNICVPGFNCYSCPGAIGACPLGALQNALASSGHRAPFYVFGILALFGIIAGRTICGWLCPVGLLQELLHKIPTPKIKKSRFTRVLSYAKYLILAYFVVAIPIMHISEGVPVPGFCKYICPVGTLEGAIGLLSNPANEKKLSMLGLIFTRKFVIMVAIFTLAVFCYRVFCRFICPLGAIYGFFSRFALLGVKVDEAKCTGCGLCVSRCEMDVRRVGDHECIQCGRCIGVCPSDAISMKTLAKKPEDSGSSAEPKKPGKLILPIAAAIVLLAALYYGNFSSAASIPEAQTTLDEATGLVCGSEPGMLCPDFSIPEYKTAAGGEVSASGTVTRADLAGKPTVLNFWATWCGGCCRELPDFQRLQEDYGDRVNILAVHSALITDAPEDFIAESGYSFRFALDEEDAVIPSLGGSTMLPQTVILSADGTVVFNETRSMTYEKLLSVILPLLGEEAPELQEEAPAGEQQPATGKAEYVIHVTDGAGKGLPGAKVQVCSALQCVLAETDESGTAVYSGSPYPYEIHILTPPAGYEGTDEIFTMPKEGGEFTVVLAEKSA